MFSLQKNKTSIQTEISAGFITFLTMAYIMIVNPMILGDAGVPFATAFFATIVVAITGCTIMALAANYPIAIAPGMGLNAYFAYSVVSLDKGIDYKIAFAAVFVAGLLFILLSLTKFREKLIEAIPNNIKHAVTAGIGLFIAFIGLRLSGIITANKANLVGLGDLHSNSALLTLVGLTVTIILYMRSVRGAIFYGMLVTGAIAFFTGQLSFDQGVFAIPTLPSEIMITNPVNAFSKVISHGLYAVVFSFLLVTLFDTTGTLVGIAQQAGFMKDGKLPRAGKAMLADSIAMTVGSVLGTSPSTAYIESSAGVAAGGRTGLTTLTVACLFGISLFFAPLIGAVSSVAAITAPALIMVGSFMIGDIKNIEWDKFDEAFPAFLVILSMPLTSSIATGIALGFISYPLLKVTAGKYREVHPLLYVFAVLFFLQIAFIPH